MIKLIRLYKYKRYRKFYSKSLIFWSILILASFYIGVALAASPFSWNVAAPANTDVISIFPALDRADKSVLGGSPSSTGGILGTLSPYGTTTTGFRENQLNDDSWLCQNAFYTSATVANRDDISKGLLCITDEVSGPYWRFMYAVAAANPITFTEVLRIVPVASTVNNLQISSAATGLNPTITATGSDTNVSLDFKTKGNSFFNFYNTPSATPSFIIFPTASLVNYFEVVGGSTGNPVTIGAGGSDTNIDFSILAKGSGSVRPSTDAVSPLGTSSFRWSNLWLSGGINPSSSLSFTLGQSAPATTATAGFPYLPATAGVPTGVPTSITGFAPIVIDTTDNRLYFYSGSWVSAVSTAPQLSVITTTSTYTTPAGAKAIDAECVGGGGGGGGAAAFQSGGGGAAGAYTRKMIASPAASYSVTIGASGAGGGAGANGSAGGQTLFGAVLTANGGGGGSNNATGGSSPTASGGDINISGAAGGNGQNQLSGSLNGIGGYGGVSPFGGAGNEGAEAGGGNNASANSGSGGGGGGDNGSGTTSGGSGGAGLCLVTAYF